MDSIARLDASLARRPRHAGRMMDEPAHSAEALQPVSAHANVDAFERRVTALFTDEFQRIFRVIHRLSGDADVASDLVQEAFVRLCGRGAMPDSPVAWLVTVALNLWRNQLSNATRRRGLLESRFGVAADAAHAAPTADDAILADESIRHVRRTLARLSPQQAQLLLLSVEGYSYREISLALGIRETSVGSLLLRARLAFRHYHEVPRDAS